MVSELMIRSGTTWHAALLLMPSKLWPWIAMAKRKLTSSDTPRLRRYVLRTRTSTAPGLPARPQVPGGEITDSKVLRGVMLNKDILHPQMSRKVEKPRVLLLDCSLEYTKGESQTNIEACPCGLVQHSNECPGHHRFGL